LAAFLKRATASDDLNPKWLTAGAFTEKSYQYGPPGLQGMRERFVVSERPALALSAAGWRLS